eukprot:1623931-Amphidinium_carterae.1
MSSTHFTPAFVNINLKTNVSFCRNHICLAKLTRARDMYTLVEVPCSRITVSNHADEWASSALIDGFTQGESLTVSIIKPVVPATADALSVTMELTGTGNQNG